MPVSAIVSGPMAATESSTRAIAALDDLYRRHVGDVYRYTYAVLGNHADAEDVTQTTFVNALRALERGEQPREPSHWLLAIAHNLVRQRWRQAAARPTMVELVQDVPDDEPGDDDVQLDELVRALQRIPTSQREALVMRELEGRSYKEIAELLGLTTSALETLLFRARRSLAEELENLVTCQSAELALSRDSDGRLSRKERKRLDEHIADCPSCARFSRTQAQQRKAFKGLAMLPLPIGLALFRDAPVAAAATVTTIGEAGVTTGAGVGTGGAAAGGGTAGGSITVGGTVAGGSLLGGAAVKVAAIVAAASVVVGVGYQGVKTLGAESSDPSTAAAAPLSKAGATSTETATAAGSTATTAGMAGATLPTVLVSGGGAAGPKAILPAEPHADAPTAAARAPANDAPTAGGTSPDAGAAPGAGGSPGASPGGSDTPGSGGAPGGGSAPGDETPAGAAGPADPPGEETPAADVPSEPGGTPPSGGTPPTGGESPTGTAPPTSSPDQPTTTIPTPRTATPKGKAKPKKPKKPKAKTPPKGKPTTTRPGQADAARQRRRQRPSRSPPRRRSRRGDGSPTAAPKDSKDPKAPKEPKQPKNDPAATAPAVPPAPAPQPTPPPAESAPPTATAPTSDEGSTSPDADGKKDKGDGGNGAGKPGKP